MRPDVLERRLRAVLDPIESWDGTVPAARSDFDLNPDMRPVGERVLRPAAVLVPVVARGDRATVLLTRRSDSLASHTGQVAFPGGRLDPGENAVQAALREAMEEVGLAADRIRPIGLADSHETGTGFRVTPVVAMIEPPFELTLNPDEVAEAFETPWEFLMDSANHRKDSMVWQGAERFFWAMPWDDAGVERYIWGATASMIRALQARVSSLSEDAA